VISPTFKGYQNATPMIPCNDDLLSVTTVLSWLSAQFCRGPESKSSRNTIMATSLLPVIEATRRWLRLTG